MKAKNLAAISLGFYLSTVLLTPQVALADSPDTKTGVSGSKAVDADFIKMCVSTSEEEKLVDPRKCKRGKEDTEFIFYRLYSDVPAFTGYEGDVAKPGVFNIPEDKEAIIGSFGKKYISNKEIAKSFYEENVLKDKNALYVRIEVDDNQVRVEEGTETLYIPLYRNTSRKQLIPPIGDKIDERNTRGIIWESNIPEYVDIEHVKDKSIDAPPQGFEAAVNLHSSLEDYPESNNKKPIESKKTHTVTKTAPPPEKEEKPSKPKEPLTLADFKWVLIILGSGAGLLMIAAAIYVAGRANERRKEAKEERRKEQDRIIYKKSQWDMAMQSINDTLADYAQKNADVANKTLFYPLIDDVTHPSHVALLSKMEKVEGIKSLTFNEDQLQYVEDFARDFKNTWNALFSTAKEVGIPWIEKREDKDRAKRLLNLVLDENAYDAERESARENLIKLIDGLFEKDRQERTTVTKSMWRTKKEFNENPLYEKYNVMPNNLLATINKTLNKSVHEISQNQAIAIESAR